MPGRYENHLTRRAQWIIVASGALLALMLSSCTLNPTIEPHELHFADRGVSQLGEWSATVDVNATPWRPGAPLQVQATLDVSDALLDGLEKKGIKPDGYRMLVTAERTFDADGHLRLPSDERMSTLITPTGLAIEGGVQGAVTKRFGYGFRTPIDELAAVPATSAQKTTTGVRIAFVISTKLPDDLPPGLYRLRFDYGVAVKNRVYSLNGESFARRGFLKEPCDSESYSPPIPASARHIDGRNIVAERIRPRIPWVLFDAYNANGYRGVVADEDKAHFALSSRNLIQDKVILPLYDEYTPKNRVAYSLEPHFPTDTIAERQNIPWNYSQGELAVQVTGPDGKTVDLGRAPFVGKAGRWPTTRDARFTQWRPLQYGRYVIKASGWMQDIWGNRYEGGGTYAFWIAKRMTLATATFQGQPYPVGSFYGRDMAFSPAVPAEVQVEAALFPNSDPSQAKRIRYSGKASTGGIFGAAQGMRPLVFDQPGEYVASVLARYTDADGHLWVSAMRHAGVVYPEDSSIVAHGKRLKIKDRFVERGETQREGWYDPDTDSRQLEHINFPYRAGDVLLIASEQEGANKIEPVLTWEKKGEPPAGDARLQGIGITNVSLQTSNGYSPHLFPEYITDWQYYYAGAPRPGLMGRFIVGENGTFAPYWPTSRHNFGGQINASSSGDMPGDIYRLLGGVVIRNRNQPPLYAGYMANAFITPAGEANNRVIAPGNEELLGANGQKARVFLALNARPGALYETGATFAPAIQIDPMLPVKLRFTLIYPDGRRSSTEGTGDASGSFVGKERWPLDIPGVYRYMIDSEWNGAPAVVPGLPKNGGEFYVIEKSRPSNAPAITFDLRPLSRFDPAKGIRLNGHSTANEVHYAAVMPGAVLMQGVIPVVDGRFTFAFDPAAIHALAPTYEITNPKSGRMELGDVIHLSFFAKEARPVPMHAFTRIILRGNAVHYTRP